ncbi:MAG: hypothetical protein IPM56_12490 [Ignavibacteriales bacterium]|nr:MAG: hypothetical protein IPM56_12490 [Ignavibacteriales bacterium]
MRIKIFSLLIVLCVTALMSKSVFPQSEIEKQYDYAIQLYSEEKYFDAVTEFKRLIFFDKNSEYPVDANRFIAESYKQGGRYDDAIKYFNIALIKSYDENKKYELTIDIIRTNILRGTIPRAMEILDSLERKNISENDINYWRGWAYIFNDEWANASVEFAKCDSAEFLSNYCRSIDEQKYSPAFAKFISLFIPGAGQIYSGEYLSGFMSLAWNVFAGYLSINSFMEDRVFDGVITSTLLWMRFYRGNLQNAEQFAIERNKIIVNDALLFLQNNYTGQKP